MPFDGPIPTSPDADKLFLADFKRKPTLPGLAYVLRNRRLWPRGFRWNFSHGHSCAMGLMRRMSEGDDGSIGSIMVALRISETRVAKLFYCGVYHPVPDSKVTAGMVADRIDSYSRKRA